MADDLYILFSPTCRSWNWRETLRLKPKERLMLSELPKSEAYILYNIL